MHRLIFVVFSLALAQGAWAAGTERLYDFVETTRGLRAEFQQTVIAKNGKRPQQSSGAMAFSRPGKFRWQIEKPYAQLIVGDGLKIWFYDPDLKQVTVKKSGAALSGTPAALLSGEIASRAALEKNFSLRDGGERDGLEWVEALPKAQDSGFDKLRLGFAGNELKAMELFDNFGQTTQLQFVRSERNPSISPALFRFTPPAGVDIIGE